MLGRLEPHLPLGQHDDEHGGGKLVAHQAHRQLVVLHDNDANGLQLVQLQAHLPLVVLHADLAFSQAE